MSRSLVPPDHADSPLAVQKSVSRKHRSPWLIVMAGGIISLIVVLVLGLLLNMVSEDVVLPHFEYQTTMPDGTILVIEAVSWGTSHSIQVRGLPRPGLFDHYANNEVYHSTAGDRLVVFMRRFDPKTGRPLDFTWWGSSSAIDAYGSEIADSNPYQNVLSYYSSGSNGGYRPLDAAGSMGYFDPRDARSAVVAHSDFPAFRVEGDTFHLLVKNTAGEVVGEFDLPYDGKRSSDVWTPDPLPVTQTDKGLTMTYTGADITVDDSMIFDDVIQYRYHFYPELQFQYNGEATTNWSYQRLWVEDPLGNTSENHDLKLSPGEPAWKMHITGDCNDWTTVPLAPGDSALVGTFTLPGASSTAPISASGTAGGKSISWGWIGAPNVTYNLGGPSAYGVSFSSNYLYVGGESISVELRSDSYSPRLLIVGGNAYTLVATDLGYGHASPPHHLEIQITTPDGVAIPASSKPLDNLVVTAFQPPEGVTEVVATLVVRQLPEFELLIAPPEHPPLPIPEMPGEPIPIDPMPPYTEVQPEQVTLPADSTSSEVIIPETPASEPPPPMEDVTGELQSPTPEAGDEPATADEVPPAD